MNSIRSLTASAGSFLPFSDDRLIDIESELIWNPKNSVCCSASPPKQNGSGTDDLGAWGFEDICIF